jgi:tRNA (guanine-N7-)-methyltransferase
VNDQQPLPHKSFDPTTFRDKPVSFVRRSGRMTPSQVRAWDEHRAKYVLDIPHGAAATSVADGVTGDPEQIFGRSCTPPKPVATPTSSRSRCSARASLAP